MVHVHCMLDSYGNKYTFGICNTNLFFTATMVPQMCLNVTLYIQYLSCYGLFHSTRLVLIAR